jgi:hypothetical protein
MIVLGSWRTLATFIAGILVGCSPTNFAVPGVGMPAAVVKNRQAINRCCRDTSGLTFVGQWWAQSISGYVSKNKRDLGPVCNTPLVREAEGISTDSSGNLYVAGDFATVSGAEEFRPNCGALVQTFAYAGGNPEDPVPDGKRVYLSIVARGPMLPGAIEVFNTTTGKRIGQLIDPDVGVGVGVAVDAHHNLFWSTTNWWTGGGQVIEFRNGHMPGVLLKATTIGSDFPGGVTIDSAANLLLIDQNSAQILIFAPPYNSSPFKKIQMKGAAWYCALNEPTTQLYCLNYTNAAVDAYSYPNGKYLYSYDNGIVGDQGPVGIAVQPKFDGLRSKQ